MTRRLALAAILMQTTLAGVLLPGERQLQAAPLPSAAPAKAPASLNGQPEAMFALQLLDICNQVSAHYVRPVTPVQLLKAALGGLFEAARVPMPATLPAEIVTATTNQQLMELIGRAQEEVAGAEPLAGRNALLVCCQAVARSLDPYSGVVTGAEQRRLLGLEQEGLGLGLEVAEHHGGPFALIKAVHPGGPAQQAGLRPDDRITHLNGQPIREWTDEAILQKLNPDSPTMDPLQARPAAPEPVTLTYERLPDAQARKPRTTTLSLMPERFEVEYVLGVSRDDAHAWNYLVDPQNGLAHVRLGNLGRGCARELGEVLTRLQDDGMRGLLLDLRWCPGGYLNEAVDVTSLFLRDGVIATVKMRVGEEQVHRCNGTGPFADLPLVLLVNAETQGGGELIAAALQDHKRAVIVGQRTLGKASVQTPIHLNLNQVGMKLTSGTFLRPSGKNLHRFPDSKDSDDWGVQPAAELDCRVSAELSRTLRQWWLLHTLRPGGSMERLPLDDPSADPQREAALEALRVRLPRKTAKKN